MPYAFQLAMIEWHPEREEVAATILAFIQFDDNTPKDSDPFTNDPSRMPIQRFPLLLPLRLRALACPNCFVSLAVQE